MNAATAVENRTKIMQSLKIKCPNEDFQDTITVNTIIFKRKSYTCSGNWERKLRKSHKKKQWKR